MKTEYYFGRLNRRLNYRLYKRERSIYSQDIPISHWYKANIVRGEFVGWNLCNELPKDMKRVRKSDASGYLFLYML
jgi:hypothetical protein